MQALSGRASNKLEDAALLSQLTATLSTLARLPYLNISKDAMTTGIWWRSSILKNGFRWEQYPEAGGLAMGT